MVKGLQLILGGIWNKQDFKELLRAGADKISVNSAAVRNPDLINDAAYKYSSGTTIPKSSPRSLDLQTGVSDALAVTIKETLDDAGTITLTLNNSNGAPFKQEIVFGANSVKSEDVKTMDGTPTNYSSWLDPSNLEVMHNSYTVTTEKTVTEIITSTWTLSSIKTLQGSVLEE